jgi:hypothetical protein
MSATAAVIGKGTTVGFFVGSGTPTFVTLAELLDIKMPKNTASPIKINRYDSPSFFEELIAGWADGGQLELTLTYVKANAAALYLMFNVAGQMQVTKPDTSSWTFQGIMTEFGDELPLKDKMTVTCKFSVSGLPVASSTSA